MSTLSQGIRTYFTRSFSKPQWRVGLGAGLGVGHSYKFIWIGNSSNMYDLAKVMWIFYEWGRMNSYELATL